MKNTKARLWINGQKNILKKISAEITPGQQYIWFHFASLGEFEQGRPVMEQLKTTYPDNKLLITFFSASGYENKKHNSLADHTFYLPADTRQNAKEFVELINPRIAVFTKYEYWYHYFKELSNRNIPLYVISANFMQGQSFFRWYGIMNRKMLKLVTHFFVQNETSKTQLGTLQLHNITVAGDTRFDRVTQNSLNPKQLDIVSLFCSGHLVFIGGSTWAEEEALITQLSLKHPHWKFILAPHEISREKISSLEEMLDGRSIRYSELVMEGEQENRKQETIDDQYAIRNTQYPVLIIDNIGMLSSLYYYANIAFIGGAFGSGLHNILEAAAFGIPVIFGPKYDRFPEAKDLILKGGGFSVEDFTALDKIMTVFQDDIKRNEAGDAAKKYVQDHTGATRLILNHISKHFSNPAGSSFPAHQ